MKRWKRWRGTVLFVGAVAALALAVVPVASAHTPALQAGIDCNGQVTWMASSNGFAATVTITSSSMGAEPGGTINSGNSFSTSGSYTTSATTETVTALFTWSDGNPSATLSVTTSRPANCGGGGGGFCHETVNPAGNPAVGNNGFPNDPFGGDAVPGGKDTSPGTNGNGPINSDGFYLVGGLLFSDTTPIAYPGGGFVWPANTTIKYTQWGNANIKITSSIGGPKSVIEFHVQAPGDLYVNAPMGAAGAIFCGVPPPPF
jgi:hypothetical protein